MKAYKKGFTIIEVVLFLAITGLMIAGILASTGIGLNLQRYKDAVDSLQSFIQSQYSQTLNVKNEILTNISCTNGSVTFNAVGTINRGQSNCVLMGRYLTSSNNGQSLESYPVVGFKSGTSTSSDDYSAIKNYTLTKIDSLVEKYNLEWSTSMVDKSKSQSNITVLIIRSPLSGTILTFIQPSSKDASLNSNGNLLNSSSLSNSLEICVVSTSPIAISGKLGVLINANASSSSGVSMITDSSGVCP